MIMQVPRAAECPCIMSEKTYIICTVNLEYHILVYKKMKSILIDLELRIWSSSKRPFILIV